MFSLSAVYSLLRPKSLCLRILAKMAILTHISVFMQLFKVGKKKKRAPLTQKETAHAYRSVFEFQQLEISCFKTAVLKLRDHATDVVPRLGMSSWLCPGWSFCLSSRPVMGGV